MSRTKERVVVEDVKATPEQYLIYLFHIVSYQFAERYTKDCDVLDYGCGSGYGIADIAAHATRAVGVDVSAEAIEYARAHFSAPRLEFAVIDPDRPLSFSDASFDTVLSFQVIEHVQNPDRYLAEVRRVLRPGGSLVLTTPDRRTRLLPTQRPWNRWHVTEYSERTLRRRLAAHFSVIDILNMTGRPEVLQIELRRTRKVKWVMLPATLPLLPDGLRTRLLDQVQKLRERRSSASASEHRDYDFDESALRIAEGGQPSVNLVAVARR